MADIEDVLDDVDAILQGQYDDVDEDKLLYRGTLRLLKFEKNIDVKPEESKDIEEEQKNEIVIDTTEEKPKEEEKSKKNKKEKISIWEKKRRDRDAKKDKKENKKEKTIEKIEEENTVEETLEKIIDAEILQNEENNKKTDLNEIDNIDIENMKKTRDRMRRKLESVKKQKILLEAEPDIDMLDKDEQLEEVSKIKQEILEQIKHKDEANEEILNEPKKNDDKEVNKEEDDMLLTSDILSKKVRVKNKIKDTEGDEF